MIVVVGAHSRKVGKTSTVTALIRALPDAAWTAIKISANRNGHRCGRGFRLTRETVSGPLSDTGRYLAAGAERSYWLRAADDELPAAMPELRRILSGSRNAIIESNRVLEFLDPDLYLLALDFAKADFKDSARRFFGRADAYLDVDRGCRVIPWSGLPTELLSSRPAFRINPPDYAPPELIEFVRETIPLRRNVA